MVNRLADDHATAKRLAHGLARIQGIVIRPEKIQSNIVMFEISPTISGLEFVKRMDEQGVKMLYRGGQRVRTVTHRMVDATDIDEVLNCIELTVREFSSGQRQ